MRRPPGSAPDPASHTIGIVAIVSGGMMSESRLLPELPSRERFSSLTGTTVVVDDGPSLTIEDVTPLVRSGAYEAFSVLLTGDPEQRLGQGMRRLEVPDAGTVDLFLVPIGPGHYEAAFTRAAG